MLGGKVLQEPLGEIGVGIGFVRLVTVPVPEQVETHHLAPDVGEQGVDAGRLPGLAEAARPPMDENDWNVLRGRHGHTVVS